MIGNNLSLKKISALEFKKRLATDKKALKWLLWFLVNPLHNYRCYKISLDEVCIGILCTDNQNISEVSFIIFDKYRRKGLGGAVVSKAKALFSSCKFKVNPLNKQSMLFFEHLLSRQIIKSIESKKGFLFYQ